MVTIPGHDDLRTVASSHQMQLAADGATEPWLAVATVRPWSYRQPAFQWVLGCQEEATWGSSAWTTMGGAVVRAARRRPGEPVAGQAEGECWGVGEVDGSTHPQAPGVAVVDDLGGIEVLAEELRLHRCEFLMRFALAGLFADELNAAEDLYATELQVVATVVHDDRHALIALQVRPALRPQNGLPIVTAVPHILDELDRWQGVRMAGGNRLVATGPSARIAPSGGGSGQDCAR